jgi:hypothetical protein
MTYPVWQTPGGDLGKISSNEFYKLHLQAGQNLTPEILAIPYLQGLIFNDGHSKIMGWALDGFPIYGPWAYKDPTNSRSGVRLMASGYGLKTPLARPAGFTDLKLYPPGIFIEDHEFTGTGDLDIHNGRICVTPDYPGGTYAYFCTWDGTKPVYPYVIGQTYYGDYTNPVVKNNSKGKGSNPVSYNYQYNIGSSNYDGKNSHWALVNGSITLSATGTPYHAYGNRLAYNIQAQNYNQTWPLAGGTKQQGAQKPRPQGIIGYWLNGVALYSPAISTAIPAGFSTANSPTYNLAFAGAKTQGYNFNEDQASGFVRDAQVYCYTDYRNAQSWYNGLGGEIFNIGGDTIISLVSGDLPDGLQFTNQVNKQTGKISYYIQGQASDLGIDKTSYFTMRAINLQNQISDQSFSITVTGNYLPSLDIQMNDLGNFLDCHRLQLQLLAMDANSNDKLVYSLEYITDNGIYTSGLPAGLSMDSSGLISGIIEPLPIAQTSQATSPAGVNRVIWGVGGFQSDPDSINNFYTFSVKVTDGKASVHRRYSMTVFATSTMTAAQQVLTVDMSVVNSGQHVIRSPIMLTTDLAGFSEYRSGEYFSFQFRARDFDGDELTYSLCGGSLGWENDSGWDSANWQSSDYDLPPGIYLDSVTGWLVGRIQAQSEYSQTYTFGVKAYKTNNVQFETGCVLYTLTVLGAIDSRAVWNSPDYLGSIRAGSPSQLAVSATALNGRILNYTLDSGSHLPDGCQLLSNGLISGRPSFQHYSLDHGKTTFDKNRAQRKQLKAPTTWDRTYEILVRATDQDNTVNDQRRFTFDVINTTYEPYNNLYLVCRPDSQSRGKILNLLYNTDIFPPEKVYRSGDPYHGTSNEFRVLTAAGLGAKSLSTYMQSMQTRHRNKRLFWNQFHYAQAKDANGVHQYDVVYVTLNQDTDVRYDLLPQSGYVDLSQTKPGWINPRDRSRSVNHTTVDKITMKADQDMIRTNSDFYILSTDNKFYLNDQILMSKDILATVGQTDTSVLPDWMSTVQPDGKVPGFQLAVVLAHVAPGHGRECLFNLKKYMDFNITDISFLVDRYVLDDVMTDNFDLQTGFWKDSPSVTFDDYTRAQPNIIAKHSVDYAVDIPFITVDASSLGDIYNLGGIDGTTADLEGKTIIFFTQESYPGLLSLPNQGWTLGNNTVIPGYYDKSTTVQNKRAGVWKISLTKTDQVGWDPTSVSWDQISYDKFSTLLGNIIVHLTFVEEVELNDIVYVKGGSRHGNNYVQYTGDQSVNLGYQFPYYRHVTVQANRIVGPTTFDNRHTMFRQRPDSYKLPLEGDRYLKFPHSVIFG